MKRQGTNLNYLLTSIIDNGDFVAMFFAKSEDKEDIYYLMQT